MTTATARTYADLLRPAAQSMRLPYNLLLVIGGSLLIAASAQLTIMLPFTTVPITGQTFAVLLVGALLGSRLGAASVLTYLAQGAAGLPVFAAGRGGLAVLAGPSAGYLLAFVIAAFIVGLLAEKGWDRRMLTTSLAMTIGTAVILLIGIIWQSMYEGPGVFVTALPAFMPGAVVKIALATVLLPHGWTVLRWMER